MASEDADSTVYVVGGALGEGDVSAADMKVYVVGGTLDGGGGGDVDAHIADPTDAHDASAVSVVPAGGIAATNVQAALEELDAEKITGVTVQEEGVSLATAGTVLNFVGTGVTASGTGATKTIAISNANPPSGAAGGVLSGTYPNPGFAEDMATQDELDAESDARELADTLLPLTTPAAGAYTLTLADAGKLVLADGDVTVPPNGTVAFPLGTTIGVMRWGAGAMSVLEGAGVSFVPDAGPIAIDGQYLVAVLTKLTTDGWDVVVQSSGTGAVDLSDHIVAEHHAATDSFDRANNALSMGTVESRPSLAWATAGDVWGIIDGQAYKPSASYGTVTFTAEAQGVAKVRIAAFDPGDEFWLIGRQGAGGYVRLGKPAAGTDYVFQAVGAGTDIDGSPLVAFGAAAEGDVLEILSYGDSDGIAARINGVLHVETGHSMGQGQAGWGLGAIGAGAVRFDDFQFTPLPGTAGQYQPTDSDLAAIAALTTTAFGRSLLTLADAAALRTAAELGTMAQETATNYVAKSLFDAFTVLAADTDNTPAPVSMGASTILARLASGGIVAASTTQIRTLLDVVTAADAKYECIIIDVSGDDTTVLTTGTAKYTFRMPYAMTVTEVRGGLTGASTLGTPTIDVNEAGVSILSTKLTFDVNEKTTTTAATPAVISDSALADDAEITIDVDVAGANATGLKVALIGTRV